MSQLIVPQYLTSLYINKPSSARPFADICHHEDLPSEGAVIELTKANTVSTATIGHTELAALTATTSHDDDPLELTVKIATNFAQVSVEAVDRGRVTESIVLADLMDGMATALDKELLSQTTIGLFDVATRIDASGTANDLPSLYPQMLQMASKSAQAVLNRGKPSHIICHPRRWFWMQSVLGSTWPLINQPGAGDRSYAGGANANGYGDGISGFLPAGLQVVMDSNVQTVCLAAAQTGGTQDVMYVVPADECILFEPANRETYIRVLQGSNLAYYFVVYEYFAYSMGGRMPAGAIQKLNGVATVAPAGF
jgi:hypothetical protein